MRLRPAWEDLRSYLIAKGRKRFEVYVCTMAERDYALEMWRLLDPEAHLIGLNQLRSRVVCVKSGKPFLNVLLCPFLETLMNDAFLNTGEFDALKFSDISFALSISCFFLVTNTLEFISREKKDA